MTETPTQAAPRIPAGLALGQAVGQAELVLTRLLSGVLAEAGTKRETYLALQRLSVHGDSLQRDRYVRWTVIRRSLGGRSRRGHGSCG